MPPNTPPPKKAHTQLSLFDMGDFAVLAKPSKTAPDPAAESVGQAARPDVPAPEQRTTLPACIVPPSPPSTNQAKAGPRDLPATPQTPGGDFTLHGPYGRELSRNWTERARDNIEAIRIAHLVASERREATPDEQKQLSRFTAFSATALSQTMFPAPNADPGADWQVLIDELTAETSPHERAHLMRSTQYAHYTPEPVISAIWKFAIRNLGFSGGNALEPGCGPGLFIAMAPEPVRANTRFTGVELDPVTALIAKALHPRQTIIEADFTEWRPGRINYDITIGNPPFSARSVPCPAAGTSLSLHSWFIHRALTLLRPGAAGIFVCSRYLLDRGNASHRLAIEKIADFLGAVRLPAGGLQYGSDTQVVSDILVFRRRAEGAPVTPAAWHRTLPFKSASPLMRLKPDADLINEWLIDHPETVIGRHDVSTSQFGPSYTCRDSRGLVPAPDAGPAELAAFSDAIYEALSTIAPALAAETPATVISPETRQQVAPVEMAAPETDNGPDLTSATDVRSLILVPAPQPTGETGLPETKTPEDTALPSTRQDGATQGPEDDDLTADNRAFLHDLIWSDPPAATQTEPTAPTTPATQNEDAKPTDRLSVEDFFQAPAKPAEDINRLREEIAAQVGTAAANARIKENSYVLIAGSLHQIIDGYPTEVPARKKGVSGHTSHQIAVITALIPIRDTIRDILDAQATHIGASASSWTEPQARLTKLWSEFVARHGAINRAVLTPRTNPRTGRKTWSTSYPNLSPFSADPDCYLVGSIENYDQDTDRAVPGAIFSERVLFPSVTPKIESAHDALLVVLDQKGRLDINEVARLAGLTVAKTQEELGDLIYPSPDDETLSTWILAEEAVSGNVREKAALAKKLAESNPAFAKVAQAITEAIPPDLEPSDISAKLGAPWISPSIVEDFCSEIMGIKTSISHNPLIASWGVNHTPFASNVDARTKWGTNRRHAGLLLEDALNSTIPQIYDTEISPAGNKIQVLNTVATEAAKDHLATINDTFSEWIWKDATRAEAVSRIYNDTYNSVVPRRFNGAHMTLPGKAATISLRALQKNAIWRAVSSGSTYFAHCVGAGKTFTIVASIMEMRRLGLITKPIITVPNHCMIDFANNFMRLYPKASILVADDTHFHRTKRQRFISRMTTGHWDAIIISHDAFKLIPAPKAFEEEMAGREISLIEQILHIDKTEKTRFSRKTLEARKEQLKDRIKKLQSAKDDMVSLAETGVDHITVDEAHLFRKLSFNTNQSTLKGVSPDGSQRAWDLYIKIRYLAETLRTGRSHNLASGTPITNTIGEMFTIMRYMAPEILKKQSLEAFDAWLATYGRARTELELQPSGLYKPVTRMTEFVNVADMMASYRSFADIILQHDLKTEVALPTVNTGGRQIIVSEQTDAFTSYQKHLLERIQLIEARRGKPEKGDDILLSVIGDGRHAAIDLRLVGYGANEPDNKLNLLIRNAFRIWQENRGNVYINPKTGLPYTRTGALQMIFSDLGTESILKIRGFSAYTWIRSELIRMGIPENEIVFMQHHKSPDARARVFSSANEGRVSIILGSTANMGTGANAQQRLRALHHLDVPWLVADIEQRDGRIVRQGNQNPVIDIYCYATKGSIDATSWQRVEQKGRFINMAFSGDRTIRRLADVGDSVAQFAMAKAMASGDDRLMRKGDLESEISRLVRLSAAHQDRIYAIRRMKHRLRETIRDLESKRKTYQDFIDQHEAADHDIAYTDTNGNSWSAAEPKDAAKALRDRLARVTIARRSGRVSLGTWHGVPIHAVTTREWTGNDSHSTTLSLSDDNNEIPTTIKEDSAPGWICRALDERIAGLPAILNNNNEQIERETKQLEDYEAAPEEPFEHAAALQEKIRELDAINNEFEKEAEKAKEKKGDDTTAKTEDAAKLPEGFAAQSPALPDSEDEDDIMEGEDDDGSDKPESD